MICDEHTQSRSLFPHPSPLCLIDTPFPPQAAQPVDFASTLLIKNFKRFFTTFAMFILLVHPFELHPPDCGLQATFLHSHDGQRSYSSSLDDVVPTSVLGNMIAGGFHPASSLRRMSNSRVSEQDGGRVLVVTKIGWTSADFGQRIQWLTQVERTHHQNTEQPPCHDLQGMFRLPHACR